MLGLAALVWVEQESVGGKEGEGERMLSVTVGAMAVPSALQPEDESGRGG